MALKKDHFYVITFCLIIFLIRHFDQYVGMKSQNNSSSVISTQQKGLFETKRAHFCILLCLLATALTVFV